MRVKENMRLKPVGYHSSLLATIAVSGLVGTTNIETAYPPEFECGTVPRCAYYAASHA